MAKRLLTPDRVMLLLSLVPYLREHGPTPVPRLAAAFDVDPKTLRSLVRFLGTAGVPGETLSYQHEDLFDIDWDALELHDLVSLTRTVAVDDAPRFAPAEAAALIAGLQSLVGMLPPEDAERARGLAAKLGDAFGVVDASAAAPSVAADRQDPRIPLVVDAIDRARVLEFAYRDAAAVETSRTVDPIALEQRSGIWYLRAHCHDRDAERSFRVEQMSGLRVTNRPAAQPADGSGADGRADASFDIIASLPAHVLPRIAAFDPEVLDEPGDGRVRVRVEGWYEDAAIRLLQESPEHIVVEAPAAARAAVRSWALRAISEQR